MSELIKLTGLWKNTRDDGSISMSGKLSRTSRLVILPNKYKKGERDPDYYAFLAPVEIKKDDEDIKM